MFSLPSIPTDNLYKFGFIGGIILLIFSSYIEYLSEKELHKIDLDNKNIGIEMSIDSVIRARAIISDSLQGISRREFKDIPQSEYKNYSINPLDTAKLRRLYAPLKILHSHDKTFDEISDNIHWLTIGMFLGYLLTLLGGLGWYFKIQQHQDILLRTGVKKSLVELSILELDLQTKLNQYDLQYPQVSEQSTPENV